MRKTADACGKCMEGTAMEIKVLQILQSKRKKIVFSCDGKVFNAAVVKSNTAYTVYLNNAGRVNIVSVPLNLGVPLRAEDSFIPAQVVGAQSSFELKSPLAGLVVKVKVVVGQFVEKNQPLVVIESMKMENEITAPFAAFIKTLSISEGNLVKPNQVIVVFEQKGEGDATTKSSCNQEAFER